MKNIALLLSLFVAVTGCKKTIESIQEDLVIKAMTDGQWKVTRFKRDTADVTTGFSTYRFQFKTNKTVEAVNNGTVESSGTWAADAVAKTITSSFGTNTAAVLQLLNGTWTITANSWTFVEANQTVNNEVRTLRLDK